MSGVGVRCNGRSQCSLDGVSCGRRPGLQGMRELRHSGRSDAINKDQRSGAER